MTQARASRISVAGHDPEDLICRSVPVPNVLAERDRPVSGLRRCVGLRAFNIGSGPFSQMLMPFSRRHYRLLHLKLRLAIKARRGSKPSVKSPDSCLVGHLLACPRYLFFAGSTTTACRLPLAAQIAAPWFNGSMVLRLSHAYQVATNHHLQTPGGSDALQDLH